MQRVVYDGNDPVHLTCYYHSAMPCPPKRYALNDCNYRKPVRQVSPNKRWLHLKAGAVPNQQMLQTCMMWVMATSTYCIY